MKRMACFFIIFLTTCPAAASIAATQSTQGKKPSTPTPSITECNKQWAQIEGNMAKMYGVMTEIQNASDPADRQKLLDEHWQLMQQNMQLMRGFGGPMMRSRTGPSAGMGPGMLAGAEPGAETGPGMMGGAGAGYGMGPARTRGHCQESWAGMTEQQRERFMQRRLDTMQMMMEQMLMLMRQQYVPSVPREH
ncbi:MAG TPA: hypothetical protein VLV32_06160 [Burkholderiales bacterium]|nr:hypothetical protein [Burkholderiales bacterium]